jgi:uncharacterized protein
MKLDKNKIEFTCEKCVECCRVDGYMYLKRGEPEKIAEYLSIPLKEFKKKFTRYKLFHGTLMKQEEDGCPFLARCLCVIYPARPAQCSEFPFWKHVLNDVGEWEYLKTFCPGVRNAKIK